MIAKKTISADNRNCFLKPFSNQYNINKICTTSKNGTDKLSTDKRGNVLGEI